MIKIKKKYFSVFGNPINHSKSPKIHNLFAKYTGIIQHYSAINVPLGEITNSLNFFLHMVDEVAMLHYHLKKKYLVSVIH
jgi:shikimate 5-dehydrogenase